MQLSKNSPNLRARLSTFFISLSTFNLGALLTTLLLAIFEASGTEGKEKEKGHRLQNSAKFWQDVRFSTSFAVFDGEQRRWRGILRDCRP